MPDGKRGIKDEREGGRERGREGGTGREGWVMKSNRTILVSRSSTVNHLQSWFS